MQKLVLVHRIIVVSITIACMLVPVIAKAQQVDSWQFNTLPTDGKVYAAPGGTTGWGYQVTNNSSTNWLFFVDVLASNPFTLGTANILFDEPSVAPGTTLIVPYDGNFGILQFTWDSSAPLGSVNSGTFTGDAFWYDSDPYSGGNEIGDAGSLTAAYSVLATNAPEPSTILLAGSGLMIWTQYGRKSKHRK